MQISGISQANMNQISGISFEILFYKSSSTSYLFNYCWGGVVGEMGDKAISAFNSVEVDVESELGNNANQPAEAEN